MANEEHLKILQQGVNAWDQWRKENPHVEPDLSYAALTGSRLREANLSKADLRGANLTRADLAGANLSRADLLGADLLGADLSRADLCEADLSRANLSEVYLLVADLSRAHLHGADLSRADLSGAHLQQITIGYTLFCDLDLSRAKDLGTVTHDEGSSIGVDTLALTLRGSGGRFTREQLIFFEGAGVPATLLEDLPRILEANPLQFYSCFISYSTRDEEFAESLNRDLNKAGIKTWKWDRDAVRGRDLGENIDRAIRNHDKTILVCSVNSLTSPQVEREIQQALDKEVQIKTANAERRKEALAKGEKPPTVDADVLIPIRLDDTIFAWDSHLKGEVTRRMVADFTDVSPGSDKYNRELQALIKALNPQSWPPQLIGNR